ncbi:hypothetical protein GCM10009777_39420 [Microbacterium pumilum]|uniref:Uncharacterized protein n=1 Tax=Microbacterium pumilum TaxID=344165 RepID=A0ABN2T635_9MICO
MIWSSNSINWDRVRSRHPRLPLRLDRLRSGPKWTAERALSDESSLSATDSLGAVMVQSGTSDGERIARHLHLAETLPRRVVDTAHCCASTNIAYYSVGVW